MDGKTLEYMGKRVDIGRNIQKDIKSLEEKKKFLEERNITSVRFDTHSNAMKIPLETRVVKEIKAATIHILETEIDFLKTQFEEI